MDKLVAVSRLPDPTMKDKLRDYYDIFEERRTPPFCLLEAYKRKCVYPECMCAQLNTKGVKKA